MDFSELWDCLLLPRKLYQAKLEPVFRKFDLTRMELDILLFLANHPQFDTARDIVEKRKLTKSHVSASVGNLIENRLLEPSFEENNRKTVHLRLLPACADIIEQGRAAQRMFFEEIFEGFGEEEIQAVGEKLRMIAANAREALKEE